MPEPVIALMGRPNVGKSTLFNRLTHSRQALVANTPGLTRDRLYCTVLIDQSKVTFVDTAGLMMDASPLEIGMATQSWRAAAQADLVIYICDARSGLTVSDVESVEKLRRQGRQVLLVANKIDGLDEHAALPEFTDLGMGMPIGISATHGRNINVLQEKILALLAVGQVESASLPPKEEAKPSPRATLRIAVVGRPNAGKSTLVNLMLGEERMLVSDIAGTTHDSVAVPFSHRGRHYILIDTAGIRRRGKVQGVVESFSVAKSLEAIRQAEVAVLLLDGSEGLVAQDLHLLDSVLKSGRSTVIAVNKWDSADANQKKLVKIQLDRRLVFAQYVKVCFISALQGRGIARLYKTLDVLRAKVEQVLPTVELTRALEKLVTQHPPPMGNGRRRIKLRYAHAGGMAPPVVVIHGNQVEKVTASYKRYLENGFRKIFKLEGTPVRIEFKSGENPYAGRKNILTNKQVKRKKRLLVHVRRKKKA